MKHYAGLILSAGLSAALFTGCGYAGPENAVKQELDLIQDLDMDTIQALVSYKDLQVSENTSATAEETALEAIRLFFENFRYKIRSSSQDNKSHTAEVNVDITNLDAQMLAKDLCRSMVRASMDYKNSNTGQRDLTSSFTLLKECLENNTYPEKTTSAVIQLTEEDSVWSIQEDSQLEDDLVGGFVSYLSDPYLLTPEDVLSCALDPFINFSAEDWIQYLEIDDIFQVNNELADSLDQLLAEQLESCFDYEILNVTQDNNHAFAEVNLTSLDMDYITQSCVEPLLDYANSTESVRATEEEINRKTAEIIMSALESSTSSRSTVITMELWNTGQMWELSLDDSFSDALLGGMDDALEALTLE
ncbi:MAG: hypothetical protein ACI4EI_13225 [Muricoprocola sp.]